MRTSKIEWALEVVKACEKRSTCLRRNVGCVLLNEKWHILSTGVNGVACGQPHCNEVAERGADYGPEDRRGISRPRRVEHYHPNSCPGARAESGANLDGCLALHAEQNALLQCRDVHEIKYCVVSCSPCITCTKLLMNTSCKEIYFMEEYPHNSAKELWESCGGFWFMVK